MAYRQCAANLTQSAAVGAQLMTEASRRDRLYRRSGSVRIGKSFRSYFEAAWREAGYCLDAPDEMPAGSCVSREFMEPGEFYVTQSIVRREQV